MIVASFNEPMWPALVLPVLALAGLAGAVLAVAVWGRRGLAAVAASGVVLAFVVAVWRPLAP